MLASCPQCSHKIQIDDAKVPDRPFSVKCPKCSNLIKFPGKTAAPVESALPTAPEPPSPVSTAPPGSALSMVPPEADIAGGVPAGVEEMRAQMMAQLRREMGAAGTAAPTTGRALVAHPDHNVSGSITLSLTRQGFAVETLEDWEEGARLLEQGVYGLVVTARVAGSQGRESLFQRINRLSPDARRRLFVVLVGDEFRSGDGTQAWVCLADLVLASRDAGSADALVRSALADRTRLYQSFLDARSRSESAG